MSLGAKEMSAQGFFSLTSASDLIAKARSDLDAFRSKPLDSYRAFNFFVTARHVPDWLFPGDEKAQKALFDKHVELRVCRHLADGMKHLVLKAPHHTQVTGTGQRRGVFDPNAFDNRAFDVGNLTVDLSAEDSHALGVTGPASAIALAERALKCLESYVVA